ncbi:MAG: hypothetical protein Kow0069_34860 [Promethearchaeota archaeon]
MGETDLKDGRVRSILKGRLQAKPKWETTRRGGCPPPKRRVGGESGREMARITGKNPARRACWKARPPA